MGKKSPAHRRGLRTYTVRVATLVTLLASSILLLAPAASAQDADGDISVAVSASPSSRAEPGGDFTFLLVVSNPGGDDITIDDLQDNVYGDLGDSNNPDVENNTCDELIGDVLGPGENTPICTYTGEFTGDAGDTQTNTVTATGTNANDEEVTDTDTATVSLTADDDEGDAGVTVELAVTPTSRQEPGGTFRFAVRVTNTGDETAELIVLRDSVVGNLDGEGTCDIGGLLDPDERFTCIYEDEFTGDAGDTRTHSVRATLEDDDGDEATDTDSVQIRITADDDRVVDDDRVTTDGGGTTIVVNSSSSSSSSAAAAASGGEARPTPTPTVTITTRPTPTPAPTPTLVRTGAESLPMGAGGLSLLMAGSLLIATAERERRRRLYGRGQA